MLGIVSGATGAATGGFIAQFTGPLMEGAAEGLIDNLFSGGGDQAISNNSAAQSNDSIFSQMNQISNSENGIFSELSDLAARPDDSSAGDLLKAQENLYMKQQILSTITNMMKSLHDMAMSVINNLRL